MKNIPMPIRAALGFLAALTLATPALAELRSLPAGLVNVRAGQRRSLPA